MSGLKKHWKGDLFIGGRDNGADEEAARNALAAELYSYFKRCPYFHNTQQDETLALEIAKDPKLRYRKNPNARGPVFRINELVVTYQNTGQPEKHLVTISNGKLDYPTGLDGKKKKMGDPVYDIKKPPSKNKKKDPDD